MSLDGEYDESNIFARMIRGEIPTARIWEDDETLAFMDLFPQSRGHCLVVSKTSRARNLVEIEPGALCTLMVGVQRTARALRTALQPDGIVLTQFNGAPAGQTVFHLHVHIIPRWEGVALTGHGTAEMTDATALSELARTIRAAMD